MKALIPLPWLLYILLHSQFVPPPSGWLTVRDEREADVYCDNDTSCDDGVSTTEDICLIDGECAHLPVCEHHSECPAPAPNATVACVNNQCLYLCKSCPRMDLNGDGKVDPADLSEVLRRWGPTSHLDSADYTLDGNVGPDDLAELLGDWQ